MDMGTLRGGITVVTLLTFLGICWWAYRSGNRHRFEEDGRIPFIDDGAILTDSGRNSVPKEGAND